MTVTFGRDTAHMMHLGRAKNGMCVATTSFCEVHFRFSSSVEFAATLENLRLAKTALRLVLHFSVLLHLLLIEWNKQGDTIRLLFWGRT